VTRQHPTHIPANDTTASLRANQMKEGSIAASQLATIRINCFGKHAPTQRAHVAAVFTCDVTAELFDM